VNIPFLNRQTVTPTGADMPFLDHLEALRWHLLRAAISVVAFSFVAFSAKSFLFDTLLLAPAHIDFATYRFLCSISQQFPWLDGLCVSSVGFKLTNIDLTGQFFIHMSIALYAGVIVAFPYIIWELWRFISPGLKQREKRMATMFIFWISLLFFLGVLFGYYVMAPFSIVFLGNYQVSADVSNQVTLDSYISTLTTLCLAAGLIFELPILMLLLGRIGLINSGLLRTYRRHAYVGMLAASAVITPSGDAGTMLIMFLPLMLLFEASVVLVKGTDRARLKRQAAAELL